MNKEGPGTPAFSILSWRCFSKLSGRLRSIIAQRRATALLSVELNIIGSFVLPCPKNVSRDLAGRFTLTILGTDRGEQI